jgi:fructokinase
MEPAAWDFIELTDEAQLFAQQADLICFGTLAQRHEVSQKNIMKAISLKKNEALVMFDVNFRQKYYSREMIHQSLLVSDILKLNEIELGQVQGMFEMSERDLLRQYDLKMLMITKGKLGSQVLTAQQNLNCPIVPCRVVDAVGAGDSFGAALVIQMMSGVELSQAQKFASEVAAYVCAKPGATVALPQKLRTI